MAAVGVLILLGGMGTSWMARGLLLRTLRDRHPLVFAELGHPSQRNLASILPRHGDLQVQFWKYLWSSKVFRTQDYQVSILAAIALLSDVALVAGAGLLLWSASG